MSTYTVYASQIEDVKKRLDRLAKKAAHYNIPFSYSVGAEHPENVRVYDVDSVNRVRYVKDTFTVSAVDVDVECDELIRANGWTVRAKLEHHENGNIATGIGLKPVKDEWFTIPARCDHCCTNRYRAVTFICENENGELRQIGKKCLKDYTGISPSTAAMWAEVNDIFANGMDCSESEWESHKGERVYSIADIVGHAYDSIQKYGYRKSDGPNSTRDHVASLLCDGVEPSAEAKAHAELIIAWLLDLQEVAYREDEMRAAAYRESEENADEYGIPAPVKQTPSTVGDLERNCIPLARAGYALMRHVGRLAYMPIAYVRYMERKSRAEQMEAERASAAALSGYVGQIGKRLTVTTASAALVTSWVNRYGMTFLYRFTDGDGNVFIWKSSRMVEINDGVTIRGTVKEHSEYRGIKQTVMTRCAVA